MMGNKTIKIIWTIIAFIAILGMVFFLVYPAFL